MLNRLTVVIGTVRWSSSMTIRAGSPRTAISQTLRWISFNMNHFELFIAVLAYLKYEANNELKFPDRRIMFNRNRCESFYFCVETADAK